MSWNLLQGQRELGLVGEMCEGVPVPGASAPLGKSEVASPAENWESWPDGSTLSGPGKHLGFAAQYRNSNVQKLSGEPAYCVRVTYSTYLTCMYARTLLLIPMYVGGAFVANVSHASRHAEIRRHAEIYACSSSILMSVTRPVLIAALYLNFILLTSHQVPCVLLTFLLQSHLCCFDFSPAVPCFKLVIRKSHEYALLVAPSFSCRYIREPSPARDSKIMASSPSSTKTRKFNSTLELTTPKRRRFFFNHRRAYSDDSSSHSERHKSPLVRCPFPRLVPTMYRRPSPLERCLYLWGLTGSPQLLARSNNSTWEPIILETIDPFYNNHKYKYELAGKYVSNIGDHPLVEKWTRELSRRIAHLLHVHNTNWSFFVPVRINRASESKVTLLISVTVEVESALAYDIVTSAKRQVVDAGVPTESFTVEMMLGGSRQTTAVSAELAATYTERRSFMNLNTHMAPFSSRLGFPINTSDTKSGSAGAFVALENPGGNQGGENKDIFLLTASHVVRAKADGPGTSLSDPLGNQNLYCCQATDHQVETRLETLEDEQQRQRGLQQKILHWTFMTEEEQAIQPAYKRPRDYELEELDSLTEEVEYREALLKCVRDVRNRDDRRIGKVSYFSPMKLSEKRPGYLADWALVKIDQEKFPQPITNTVRANYQNTAEELDLQGVISVKEANRQVCKHGAATQFTRGRLNEIEAVVRDPWADHPEEASIAWELIVVGVDGKFSAVGDSGSVVFDKDRRIVGLQVASISEDQHDNVQWRLQKILESEDSGLSPGMDKVQFCDLGTEGKQNMPDVSFVSPINWVLEDIEAFTGKKVSISGQKTYLYSDVLTFFLFSQCKFL